jgi:hypothetical protein
LRSALPAKSARLALPALPPAVRAVFPAQGMADHSMEARAQVRSAPQAVHLLDGGRQLARGIRPAARTAASHEPAEMPQLPHSAARLRPVRVWAEELDRRLPFRG